MSRAQLTSTVEQNSAGAAAPYVAGKNFCINGGMDIWQRGTSFVAPSNFSYTADRWASYAGSSITVAQETSNVPTGSRYALKMTANATEQMFIRQVIETANTIPLAGKTITVSAQVAASTSTTLGFTIAYSTNVDETISTSGAWNTLTPTGGINGGTYTNVPTTYVTLVGTYAVPSNAKSLLIYFGDFSATVASGTSFYITQVQVEIGSSPTSFSRAGSTLQGELALCQRYFEMSYDQGTAIQTNTGVGRSFIIDQATSSTATYGSADIPFKVTKRATPAVTLYRQDGSSTNPNYWIWYYGGTNYAAFTVNNQAQNKFSVSPSGSLSGLTTGAAVIYIGHWTASAEL